MSRTLYDCPRISRRITTTLFATQSLARAAFIACGTVGALVGIQLSGSAAWAGVPAATLQLAGAFAALVVGVTTERIGRRLGLALGLGVGVLGMGVAAGGIVTHALLLFLGGLVLMGVASAAMQLGRFAVAEVHPPERRGQAISNVVIGGAIGSVVGPLLVGPSGQWAQRAGVDELAGPYLAALIILAVAALAVFVWLRPDPRDVGRKMAEKHPEPTAHRGPTRSIYQILRTPVTSIAVLTMTLSQMVMVAMMVITTPYMMLHQHDLTDISVVISAHTFGMFAFSFVAGRLTDRWGRGWVILTGAGLLVLACALAPLSPGVLPLSAALFLLGLGWNFCFVGGSTLLSDQLSATERAKTQGVNDLMIGLATAGASLVSGLMFAFTGYTVIGIVGVVLSLVPLGLTAWWMVRGQGLAALGSSRA
ncbi:MAG TPA: MFS transporter [Anaerolineae bacterium]|nr:MFS transporter [Anaerolineae bacterium]